MTDKTTKEEEKAPKATEADFGCCLILTARQASAADSTGCQNIAVIHCCVDTSLEAEMWHHDLTPAGLHKALHAFVPSCHHLLRQHTAR